jgi:hypothetical protein
MNKKTPEENHEKVMSVKKSSLVVHLTSHWTKPYEYQGYGKQLCE